LLQKRILSPQLYLPKLAKWDFDQIPFCRKFYPNMSEELFLWFLHAELSPLSKVAIFPELAILSDIRKIQAYPKRILEALLIDIFLIFASFSPKLLF
jgi:hypothetical protein